MKEHLEELLSSYITLSNNTDSLGHSILRHLKKDKTMSLDERWKIYEKLVDQNCNLDVDIWIVSLKSIDEDKYTLYDNFYKDRYATVYFTDMLETIIDEKYDVDINEFKEEVLSLELTGFIYDW